MIERFLQLWCRTMHGRNMSRAIKGHYTCWTCLREYRVQWTITTSDRESANLTGVVVSQRIRPFVVLSEMVWKGEQ